MTPATVQLARVFDAAPRRFFTAGDLMRLAAITSGEFKHAIGKLKAARAVGVRITSLRNRGRTGLYIARGTMPAEFLVMPEPPPSFDAETTWKARMVGGRYADVSRIVPSRGRMPSPEPHRLGASSLVVA